MSRPGTGGRWSDALLQILEGTGAALASGQTGRDLGRRVAPRYDRVGVRIERAAWGCCSGLHDAAPAWTSAWPASTHAPESPVLPDWYHENKLCPPALSLIVTASWRPSFWSSNWRSNEEKRCRAGRGPGVESLRRRAPDSPSQTAPPHTSKKRAARQRCSEQRQAGKFIGKTYRHTTFRTMA